VRVERGGRTIARLGPGEAFGELSVIDREPRSATVIVEGDTELLAIAQEDFYELLADYPGLSAAVMRVMSRRLRTATAGGDNAGAGGGGGGEEAPR
jgi:CRP-like cAMP-binding protein